MSDSEEITYLLDDQAFFNLLEKLSIKLAASKLLARERFKYEEGHKDGFEFVLRVKDIVEQDLETLQQIQDAIQGYRNYIVASFK
jgi:hypothetical protein